MANKIYKILYKWTIPHRHHCNFIIPDDGADVDTLWLCAASRTNSSTIACRDSATGFNIMILPQVSLSWVNFGQDTIQLSIEMKDPLPSLNNTGAHWLLPRLWCCQQSHQWIHFSWPGESFTESQNWKQFNDNWLPASPCPPGWCAQADIQSSGLTGATCVAL